MLLTKDLTVQIDGILNALTPGLSLLNTTSADETNTRQDSPALLLQGSAWDTDDTESKPQFSSIYLNGDNGNQAFLNIAFGDSLENLSSLFQFGNDGVFYTDSLQVNGNFAASNVDLGNGVVITRSGSDSVVLQTTTSTDPVWLKFNGSGALFPGIKRSTTELHFKLANDSAFTNIRFNQVKAGEWQGTAIADAYIASASVWNGKQDAIGYTPENLANKDQNSGYAGLDSSGKINPNQLPALAITDTFVVASQVAMLALTAEVGDIAVRTDLNKSFILKTAGATVLANWQELLTPTDSVTSVFGRSGTVTAQSNDYTFAQIGSTPTTLSGYSITDAQPINANLTTISGLTPTNDDVMQYKSGAWANRTIAQLKSDLSLSGTNTGDQTNITGNAGTATALETARAINGVSFDGTSQITVTAAAGTLTGTTLNATVVTSSLTTIGTVTSGGLGSGASVGAVTMSLGSDANGDIYYRSSNVLTRLAKGTALQQLRMNAGATAPEWATISSSGATTALDNLASVAINTALLTGAGVAAAFTATQPAQITTAQVGIAATLTASAAVAGSSVAGAAAGGAITLTTGNAARLTSGDANGGDINLTCGTGIGSGTQGNVVVSARQLRFPSGSSGAPGIALSSFVNSGLYHDGNGLAIVNSSTRVATCLNGGFYMNGAVRLGTNFVEFGSGDPLSVNGDVALQRNGTSILEVNNRTGGQWAALKCGTRDASVSAITNGLTLGHLHSSGTPAAGMGSAILFNINSSTTIDQNAAQIAAIWTTATHASRTADLVFYTVNNAAALAESARMLANGNFAVKGGLLTADPTSGDGPAWKLGAKKSAVVTLVTTDYVEVSISGFTYKLAIVN